MKDVHETTRWTVKGGTREFVIKDDHGHTLYSAKLDRLLTTRSSGPPAETRTVDASSGTPIACCRDKSGCDRIRPTYSDSNRDKPNETI